MRYFFGFLLAVALIIVVFILIVRGLGGGRQSTVDTQLTDYAKTDTVMRMVIEGEVNIDQNHRSVSVVVGRNSNTISLVEGYRGRVLETQTYPSNEEGYATFLRALQLQGYTKGDDNPELEDSRGVCPTGRIYSFEIMTGSSIVQRFWTSSCGGGTFDGNADLIRQLFRAQIPDFSDITAGSGLR